MDAVQTGSRPPDDDNDPFRRDTICIADPEAVLQPGDPGFRETLSNSFTAVESRALERTCHVKQRLRDATTYDFLQILMESMTEIMGAQYAFVAKRVLPGNEKSAVEMPVFGEPGSCLMGLAFYFNDHKGKRQLFRDYKYEVYGCPCQWMRHDKVLLMPQGLSVLTPNNPNSPSFPLTPEGYLAVPLFHEGKCFAHFGVMFTAEGLSGRRLSWAMMEMFLHSLEDQVCARVLEGIPLGEPVAPQTKVIPQQAVTNLPYKHSLRPYARRLSHELRTPMQGVVGMLDVMYASVVAATESAQWEWADLSQLRDTIEGIRTGIEVAQDSSKRAIDAADNMVHAYDFDMQVPSTPFAGPSISLQTLEEPDSYPFPATPSTTDDGDETIFRRPVKRRRESGPSSSSRDIPRIMSKAPKTPRPVLPNNTLSSVSDNTSESTGVSTPGSDGAQSDTPRRSDGLSGSLPTTGYFSSHAPMSSAPFGTPGLSSESPGKMLNARPVKLRELLHQVVHDSLRTGGRPDCTQSVDTPRGEQITIQSSGASVEQEHNMVVIEVSVNETVPDIMITDGITLSKVLSSVFHNAVKFTPYGRISVTATTSNPTSEIVFMIEDTGEGIPEDFLPDLFKPFSREDVSLTRHRDGLGLGLMVAKGIARKMGGDLWCERTSTEAGRSGSEFRIRLPIVLSDTSDTEMANVLDNGPSSVPDAFLRRPQPSPLPSRSHTVASPQGVSSNSIVKRAKKRKPLPFDPDLGKKLPLKILVVEDNRINRNLLCSMLKRLGFSQVDEARDGIEAVEVFAASMEAEEGAFDLILMDLWMPRMDGFDATDQILKMVRNKNGEGASSEVPGSDVTVLAVSADATEEARAKAAEKGVRGFVGKPFGMTELERAVWEYCAEAAQVATR